MRKVVAYTTLALGLAAAGSAFAGGIPSDYDPCGLDKKIADVVSFMKDSNVKFYVAPNKISDKISVNGLLNVDYTNLTGAENEGRLVDFGGPNDNLLYVNNANLMVAANVNKYVDVNADIAYVKDSQVANAANNSDENSIFGGNATVGFDEVYATFHHFPYLSDWCQPVVVRLGKMYNGFGVYKEAYPLMYSFTQTLSQQRTTNAEIGYGFEGLSPMLKGLYAQYWLAQGDASEETINSQGNASVKLRNMGAKVGYANSFMGANFAGTFAWTHDIRDSDWFADEGLDDQGDLKRTAGISGHLEVNYGPFGLQGNYAGALDQMAYNYTTTIQRTDKNDKSRLWAADGRADYKFMLMNLKSKLGVGYQVSGQFARLNQNEVNQANGTNIAIGAQMPKYRWYGDYTVKLNNNVAATVLYARDTAYKGSNTLTGNDRKANRYAARVSVQL